MFVSVLVEETGEMQQENPPPTEDFHLYNKGKNGTDNISRHQHWKSIAIFSQGSQNLG